MPFKKGQSGNPGGRPKQPKDAEDLRALCRAYTPELLAALLRIARNKRAPSAAVVKAVQTILERGWGKPAQELYLPEPVRIEHRRIGTMDAARRIALVLHMADRGVEGDNEISVRTEKG